MQRDLVPKLPGSWERSVCSSSCSNWAARPGLVRVSVYMSSRFWCLARPPARVRAAGAAGK